MAMSMRENFLTCINGGVPEFVPRYYGGKDPYATLPQQTLAIATSVNARTKSERGLNKDIWGVEYIGTEETGGQELPVPGEFLIEDIRKWRDVIKAPDLSGVDWELVAKRDLDALTVNPADVAVSGGGGGGYFMPHMNLMGFTNGLVSYYEEPDEVKALYEYFNKYWMEVIKNFMQHYPCDIFGVSDDTATAYNPFISPEMYREFIVPYVSQNTIIARDRGMPIMMHDCGRCEDFIEDWRDLGVNSWNPAQVVNDLDGIKKKYGNELVLIGCWDSQGPAGWDGAPEELVRQAVRDTIDRYAPGGGFMFWGSVYGAPDDPAVDDKRRWMQDEYEKYRETPYK